MTCSPSQCGRIVRNCKHGVAARQSKWGGRRDLNPQQPVPQTGALTGLSYAHHNGKVAYLSRTRRILSTFAHPAEMLAVLVLQTDADHPTRLPVSEAGHSCHGNLSDPSCLTLLLF